MGVPPAKLHEKLGAIASPASLVGRTPWSAADAHVGLLAPRKMPMSLCRLRDEGVQDFRVLTDFWRWEPGGRALIYVDSTPGYSNFMRLPLNTGKPTPISALTSNRISAFDSSRDGSSCSFAARPRATW